MKKLISIPAMGTAFAAAAFTLFSFVSLASAASNASGTQIMIMTHLCDSSIANVQAFEAMENGRSPVANLGNDVLHCPTTGLPLNAAVSGTVASPRTTYNFSVQSGNGPVLTLQNNGMFEPHKACETDLNVDVNGDGVISSSTCLDISHYVFTIPNGSSSFVNVKETQAPSGFHFGTLRFTPVVLDGNNDSESLASIDAANGQIDVNTTPDKDGMIMLHVYQFVNPANQMGNGSSTSTSTASSTGMGSSSSTLSGGGQGVNSNATIDMPGSVRTGTSVDFVGRNFGHEETVAVMLNSNVIAKAHADGGGNFSTGSLPVPSTPGSYLYAFIGQTSGMNANTTLMVTP